MELVKGFKDFTGVEARKRELIKEILTRNFKLYGFEAAETPIVEFEDFVKGENSGDEAVSDIFKLQDKGKRKLALRYEFTFQLKRIAQNRKLPYKRFQIGEVFRDEPVSANRFRQFTQCDADIVGSTIKDDAEIIVMSSRILKDLGIKSRINVNNRKLINEILDEEGIKEKERVIREIDKIDKLTEKEIKENLKAYNAEKVLSIFKKPETFFKKYKSYSEIEELRKACALYDVKINFQPSLARGLSYYNGTVVEIKTEEMRETIVAGGSYLVNNVQSTGISFGLERIGQIANVNLSDQKVLVISIGQDKKAVSLVENLRNKGISSVVMFGKISKALEFANSYLIPYVVFLGEDEVKKKKFKLRDTKSGKEEFLAEKALTETLLK